MILTQTNDDVKRLTPEQVLTILKECDHVHTFTECGWLYVFGWVNWHDENRDAKLVVKGFVNDRQEYESMKDHGLWQLGRPRKRKASDGRLYRHAPFGESEEA